MRIMRNSTTIYTFISVIAADEVQQTIQCLDGLDMSNFVI